MTIATAKFRVTPELSRQQLADWTKSVSRRAKWAKPVAISLILVGIASTILMLRARLESRRLIYPVGVAILGVVIALDDARESRKWLKRIDDSRVAGKTIEFRFEEDVVHCTGPTSQSRTEWDGFERLVPAAKGFFLYTERGVHVYVPYEALDPPGSETTIIAHFEARNRGGR